MVVKIRVPFWVPIIIRHLLFRVPKKGPYNFDNHPYGTRRFQHDRFFLGSKESGLGDLVADIGRELGFLRVLLKL